MAKSVKSVSFSKATISMEDGTISEYLKDETNVFKLEDVLKDWDGVEGITLTIKKDTEVSSPED